MLWQVFGLDELFPKVFGPGGFLGRGVRPRFGFGAIDSLCDSGLLTPPLLQMLLELFIRFWAG